MVAQQVAGEHEQVVELEAALAAALVGGRPSEPEESAEQDGERVDAGPGDRVIVAHGSRVRDLTVGAEVADKDVIVGIVDGHQIEGQP